MSTDVDDLNEDQFNLNHEHARAAYANAQEAVRFIDSKAGILTGIVTVSTALPFAVLQVAISSESDQAGKVIEWYGACGPIAAACTAVPMIAGIIFGTQSLLSSTNGLMSRHSPITGEVERGLPAELCQFLIGKIGDLFRKRNSTPRGRAATSLFPAYSPAWATEEITRFGRLARGEYTRREVLAEYGDQLECIGVILHTKIARNRDAVRWFELQIFSYMVAAMVVLVVFFCCHAPAETARNDETASQKIVTSAATHRLLPNTSPTKLPNHQGASSTSPNR